MQQAQADAAVTVDEPEMIATSLTCCRPRRAPGRGLGRRHSRLADRGAGRQRPAEPARHQGDQYGSQLRQNNLDTQAAISRFSGKQAVTASIFKAGGNLVDGLSKIKMGNSALQ